MGKTIVVASRKGGVGKTQTAVSLAAGLARTGKRVLLVDTDSQRSATLSLGIREPEKLTVKLSGVIGEFINEGEIGGDGGAESDPAVGIIRHEEEVDLMPADSELTSVEHMLVPLIGRETVLRQYVERVKPLYDWIVLDTSPNLGLLTVNALAAADSVIIPVAPKYLDAVGLELLLKAVAKIRRNINPTLEIAGILLTMVDRRSRLTREVIELIEDTYGSAIKIFGERVPFSVRAAESSARGVSIFRHEPNGKVAAAYAALVVEVLKSGE